MNLITSQKNDDDVIIKMLVIIVFIIVGNNKAIKYITPECIAVLCCAKLRTMNEMQHKNSQSCYSYSSNSLHKGKLCLL